MALLGKIRNKKIVILFFLLPFFAIFFIQSCGSDSKKETTSKVEKKTDQRTKVFVPQFNSDSAYYFIKQQVDFGPRVPNSIAHQNCYLYLKSKLSNYGASIIVQEDTVRRFDGDILNMKNNKTKNKKTI